MSPYARGTSCRRWGMGPSSWHTNAAVLHDRVRTLDDPMGGEPRRSIVSSYRRRGQGGGGDHLRRLSEPVTADGAYARWDIGEPGPGAGWSRVAEPRGKHRRGGAGPPSTGSRPRRGVSLVAGACRGTQAGPTRRSWRPATDEHVGAGRSRWRARVITCLVEEAAGRRTEAECRRLVGQGGGRRPGVLFAVLSRAALPGPIRRLLKQVVDSGADRHPCRALQHLEPVRLVGTTRAPRSCGATGRRADEASFMLLAKSCHDHRLAAATVCRPADLAGCPASASLDHFRAENKPAGAADRLPGLCGSNRTAHTAVPAFYLHYGS